MDDALLVSRAIGGDLDSFGQLYDRYFHRVYDFSWRTLRDGDEAADATRDAFLKAMRALPSLGRAASFKSWLFTIAHDVAVTRAERIGRTVTAPAATAEEGFGAFEAPDPSRVDDPELAAVEQEQPDLVWEAVSALNPRDYALLDLHVRQGLEGAEIAGVMGVSKGNASTMASRMKQAAADVITSYIVARRGSRDCDALRTALEPFSLPPYTDAARRAVDSHIRECDFCQESRRGLAAPLEIFGAFAMVDAPFALKAETWQSLAEGWLAGPAEGAAPDSVAAASAPPEPPPGFGSALSIAGGGGGAGVPPALAGAGDSPKRTVLLFIGGVIGLLAVAFGGAALIATAFGDDDDDGRGSGAAVTATRAARTAQPRTPGIAIDSPTPDLTPSSTPTPEDTPTPEPPTPIPQPATSTPPAATATADNSTATVTPRPTRTLVPSPTVPPSATPPPPVP